MQIRFIRIALAAATLLLGAIAAKADDASRDVLATLRKGHPRLILTSERLQEIQASLKTDPQYKNLMDSLLKRADKILGDPVVKYEIIGPRLLAQSRKCLDEVTTCALVYRLTGEKKYADRALADLLAVSGFKDWNPSHFLDTAEMSCAVGLGYDWLFDAMTPEERTTIRAALVKNGLKQGELSYSGKGTFWWTTAKHNWSQVCNGGLAVGALAVADEEPELARTIVTSGLKSVRLAYANWDKDGGWAEGPGYWGYTTLYTAYHLAALQSALGTMDGLEKTPGLSEAGMFRLHFIGPTGKTFNFADADAGAGSAAQMFLFSRVFDRPVYAWHHRQEKMGTALDLLWMDERGNGPKETALPTDKLFHDINVVFLRSGWEDPQATWLGIKGGDNAANHSHLDLGTFVLDAAGKRWAEDLGSDDYLLPGYFGPGRYDLYRLKTAGQNTLVINGESQPKTATASVIAFAAGPAPHALIDLSEGYPAAKRVWRGAERQGAAIVLVDEIEAEKPLDVEWRVHTTAKVAGAGSNELTLTLGDQQCRVRLIEPAGGVIDAGPVEAAEGTYKHSLEGISVLRVKLSQVKTGRIAVGFSTARQPEWAKVPALSVWAGQKP